MAAYSLGLAMWSNNDTWTKYDYSLEDYPFPRIVTDALQLGPLASFSSSDDLWVQRTDQSSVWHNKFYETFQQWRTVYDRFVEDMVAPWVGSTVYYQAIPTFRVHQPNNVAVGEFHKDSQYSHPSGEITFWVPLTPAYDTNSVWVEDDRKTLRPFEAMPGNVIAFSAVTRRHGNLVNKTGAARVSFDFRCIPVDRLPIGEVGRSVNSGLAFVPGEYYASSPVGDVGQ